jgi:hypothetical protein
MIRILTVDAILVLALAAAVPACSGTARGLEAYRTDTEKLLDTRSAQLKSCYDDTLKTTATAAGTVTVQFVVEKKSGVINNPMIDAARSTAPAPLGECVVKAIDGLKLDPADRNEGRATFVYEFKPQSGPSAPSS